MKLFYMKYKKELSKSMKLDTTEPLKPESNVWENGVTQPTNPPNKPKVGKGESGKNDKLKDPTEDQASAIVKRISKARTNIQAEQAQQAVGYADAVTESVMTMAAPLIGLRMIEKGVGALSSGGNLATSFLRSMPNTGITLEADLISMTDTDDPLQLEAMDDPLIAALMLTGV